jgi:hypothetical protein
MPDRNPTQYIYSITCIRRHLLRFLSIFPSLVGSVEKPPWGTEPIIELGPASHQADALPTELHFLQFQAD